MGDWIEAEIDTFYIVEIADGGFKTKLGTERDAKIYNFRIPIDLSFEDYISPQLDTLESSCISNISYKVIN